MLKLKLNISVATLAALLQTSYAFASCDLHSKSLNDTNSLSIAASLTTVLEQNGDFIIEVVRPPQLSSSCLIFISRNDQVIRFSFELELNGQLGLHLVNLGREYLVVESMTPTGTNLSEIFAFEAGRPIKIASIFSSTPASFSNIAKEDLVYTTEPSSHKERTTSLSHVSSIRK